MSASQPIPAHVIDEATDWLVLLHSGEVTELQLQQFEQWKAEKQQNALAIQQIERLTHGLSNLPSNFQPELLVSSEKKFHSALKRNILFSFSGLFFLGFMASCFPWAKWQADYHTEVGEIKSVLLEDGSQLILSSDSYVKIKFSTQQRQVNLIEGEIYIQTAKDQKKHRPFIVETQDGQVEALGTQFTVRQENSHKTKVSVYQHAVAIHADQLTETHIIHQGHRVVFDDNYISKSIALQNDSPDWTQRLLVVEKWPLEKVLSELYRYKKGTYFLDESLKAIPVSGVFSLQNTQQSLETLAYSHQLDLNFYSPYVLKIKKKIKN